MQLFNKHIPLIGISNRSVLVKLHDKILPPVLNLSFNKVELIKKAFNDMNIINFENLEVIRNEKNI